MPTYDYICEQCGLQFEEFQSMAEEPLKSCPKCQGPVRRKIGAGAGLVFKGSGFYITDYKKKGSKSTGDSVKPKEKSKTDNSKKKAS